MLALVSLVLFGFVVGVIAKLLMPGRDPGGFLVTILLGIAGAVIGGFLGQLFGWYGPEDRGGFVAAVIGSIVLLGLYRMTLGNKARTTL
jgi:uncharacterized membrane protein YeaQ/YmgE (transglycosylase-associated protein family)